MLKKKLETIFKFLFISSKGDCLAVGDFFYKNKDHKALLGWLFELRKEIFAGVTITVLGGTILNFIW